MEKFDKKTIVEIFIKINEMITNLYDEYDFFVKLEITTLDGIVTYMELSNNEEKNVNISKNIIVYDNVAIAISDIVKVKILTDNEIKDELIMEFKNTDVPSSRSVYNKNYQRRYSKKMNDKNIEDYIKENYKNIDSIKFNSIVDEKHTKGRTYEEITKEDVLSNETYLDSKQVEVLQSVNIDVQKTEAINYIKTHPQEIITNIEVEEKEVLTNNAQEVEVARPVQTKPVKVITNIDIDDCDVVVAQSTTSAIKDIKQNQSDVVIDIAPDYIDGVIGNINTTDHIIKSKTIEILGLEPLNKYVDKLEINSKSLIVDPTGDGYVGVVLDDGTFEPLKIELKTITVLEDDSNNLLGNIDINNQIGKVVKDISQHKANLIQSLDIEYTDDLLEYKSENLESIKNIINTSKDIVNSITNKYDTVNVVTKEETELINDIINISENSIQQIEDIKTTPVIKSVKPISDYKRVTENIKLSKINVNVVKDIETVDKNDFNSYKQKINGNIEYIGDGIMIVNNGDSDITIYSTDNINSVNL